MIDGRRRVPIKFDAAIRMHDELELEAAQFAWTVIGTLWPRGKAVF